MENEKELNESKLKQDNDCIELSDKELNKIAGGKIRYPEQREVN